MTDVLLVWAISRATSKIAGGLMKEMTHLYLVASIDCNPPTERTIFASAMNITGDPTDKILAENVTVTALAVRTGAPPTYLRENGTRAGNDKTGERQVSNVEDTTVTDD